MTTPLQQAAQAVIDRCYEYNPHELPALHLALRKALDAELQKTVEPVAWAMRRADGLVLDVICPDEHESHEGEYTIPLYLHPPQQVAVTSGERAALIELLRDLAPKLLNGRMVAAAANMLEADAQQAKPTDENTVEYWKAYSESQRESFDLMMVELKEFREKQAKQVQLSDDLTLVYMVGLEKGKTLKAKQVPMTDDQIIATFCTTPDFRQYVSAFKAGVKLAEKYHGIGDQP